MTTKNGFPKRSLSQNELILFDAVKEVVELRKKAIGTGIIYAKSWEIEDELVEKREPLCITTMKSPHRKQVITWCLKSLGFQRRGKHIWKPLWVMEV